MIAMPAQLQKQGKVKWFNNTRGFGFITLEDGTDAFVHYSNITGQGHKSLKEGQQVACDIVTGDKGQKAVNVTPA